MSPNRIFTSYTLLRAPFYRCCMYLNVYTWGARGWSRLSRDCCAVCGRGWGRRSGWVLGRGWGWGAEGSLGWGALDTGSSSSAATNRRQTNPCLSRYLLSRGRLFFSSNMGYFVIQICVPNSWYLCAPSRRNLDSTEISAVRYTNVYDIVIDNKRKCIHIHSEVGENFIFVTFKIKKFLFWFKLK